MAIQADHDAKEAVRRAIDIVDLVGGYLNLRRQGRHFVGLCPWHSDSRPSLQVNPERQSWKCWVCDVGGDIFDFLMQREGLTFPEALNMLAEKAGVEIRRTRSAAPAGSPQDKTTLFRVMKWAEEQYHRCLTELSEGEPGRVYLAERGIDSGSIERFHLGFAPAGRWLAARAQRVGFGAELLAATGLTGTSQQGRVYERFGGRVLFPIRDIQHRPIAFGGRVLPGGSSPAKYINSPETRLFSKSQNLYALDLVKEALRQQQNVIVVEGYTDVVMAHQFGLDNVVAVLGTALTPPHIQVLRRFAERITLVLDGDEAGQRRTNELLELFLTEQVDLRIVTLPAGADPCDFVREHGADAFRARVESAPDAIDHKVRVVTADLDVTQPHQANRALEDILQTLAAGGRQSTARVPDALGKLRQQQLLTRLARHFRVSEDALRNRLGELQAAGQLTRREIERATPKEPPTRSVLGPTETELLEIVLLDPELFEAPENRALLADQLRSDPARELLQVMEQVHGRQLAVDFQALMSHLDEPRMRNLLVDLDEQAQHKQETSQKTPCERFEQVVRNLRCKAVQEESRRMQVSLETQQLEPQEQLSTLEQMIAKQRDRLGLSAPTDG